MAKKIRYKVGFKAMTIKEKLRIMAPGAATVREAARRLAQGEAIGLPTETVYGLAADATDDRAVARIFEIKQRPKFNPLIIHLTGLDAAEDIVTFNGPARQLARAFWPGPLSLVLPRTDNCPVSLLAGAGLDHLAVRAPDHDVCQEVLRAFAKPVAAPSANLSGTLSPTRAEHVAASLPVDFVIDGGPCPVGLESTIVRVGIEQIMILRPGAVTAAALEEAAGLAVVSETANTDAPSAPGQMESHYAPRHPLRLGATDVADDEALLAFGTALDGAGATANLSEAGDLAEAAANLFAMMRELDATTFSRIAVMPVPDGGLGFAINDRLRRAAAPRGQSR